MKPTAQIYSQYTEEDFQVWKILFDRQMEQLEGKVAGEFLEALEKVNFNRDEIPNFKKVNQILGDLTGWQLITVPNISPAEEFFKNLAEKNSLQPAGLEK
jgi:phenylalanine-4-hydroxylase